MAWYNYLGIMNKNETRDTPPVTVNIQDRENSLDTCAWREYADNNPGDVLRTVKWE